MSAATHLTMAEQRKIVGFTQAELADLCSVGTPHISKIENGKEQPSPALAHLISGYLDVHTDEACEYWFDLCASCDGTGNVKCKSSHEHKVETQWSCQAIQPNGEWGVHVMACDEEEAVTLQHRARDMTVRILQRSRRVEPWSAWTTTQGDAS